MSTDALDVLDQMMMGPQSPGSNDRLATFIEWANTQGFELGHKPELFWIAFHRTWNICDNTWDQRGELLETASFFHGECSNSCELLQETASKDFHASLPDRITVYRGCSMDRVMGLAWTIDKSIALGFARGHRGISVPDPVLASAFVRKHQIFGAYQERQESEIVVDPRDLTNIRVRHLVRARDWA